MIYLMKIKRQKSGIGKKKSMKSYLFPNPHLRHLDMTRSHKTKSLQLLKNGSRAEGLKAISLKVHGKVILLNTCAFDTAVSLIMVSLCDSKQYLNSLSSSFENDVFIDYVK